MIVRLGFLVAASIAAYAVQQANSRSSRSSSLIKPSENDEASTNHGDNKEQFSYSDEGLKEEAEEEEKEEVKLINGIINPALSNQFDNEDELFPEFENLLSGEIDFPLPVDKYDTEADSREEKNEVYESEMANNASELERLRNLVKELEEREVKLEEELFEYYGLMEQESNIAELQKQLKIKTMEIEMLNITINSLQAERKKLQEEVSLGAVSRKDLEGARKKLKELQRQIQLESNQTKGQLLLLKQQVSGLQAKEEEAVMKDAEVGKKLKDLKELEVEVMELKRKNKELQHEKRELIVKLDTAEAKVNALSNMTEV
ncbi:CHUP1, chloroplastic [Olea europaea subsp. europaea]|uniref:CHUP1, chloroplastic n=1 Tax=Olea europaea subsp. europaea TaxID=158383 RepID=A0A8S0Q132_OLEEU|nr:CHUP1, chloroplastic [Olea europaea subsp. europaea]